MSYHSKEQLQAWSIIRQFQNKGDGNMLIYTGKDKTERTGEQLCRYVARWLKKTFNISIPAKKIWDLSSTGELWPVYYIYTIARAWNDTLESTK